MADRLIKIPMGVLGKINEPKKPSFDWDIVPAGATYEAVAYQGSERENVGFVGEFNERYRTITHGFSPFKGATDNSEINQAADAIRLAQMAYYNDATVRNTVDMLTELSSEGLHIKHDSPSVLKFFRGWLKQINFESLLNQILLEYFRSGNVGIYRFDGQLTGEDRQTILRSMNASSSIIRGLAKAKTALTLPVRYTVLNPLSIKILGSSVLDTQRFVLALPKDDVEMIVSPTTEEQQKIVARLPNQIIQAVRKAAKTRSTSNVLLPLDPEYFTMIFRQKQPYEPFAIPFLFSVADDIAHKKELKNLDRAASRAVQRFLLHVKLGDKDNPPKKSQYQEARKILASGAVSQFLITPYNVEIQPIIPPIDKILGSDKFNAIDKDILRGLGINEVIIGGQGGSNFSNSFLAIKALLERLEDARNKIINEFILPEFNRVCKSMGFKRMPTVQFKIMNLRDENAERRVVASLVNMGIMSPQSAINVLNSGEWPTVEEELKRQKEWKDMRDDGMFLSVNERSTINRSELSTEVGRPTGPTGPQQKQREQTPRGLNTKSSQPEVDLMVKINQMLVYMIAGALQIQSNRIGKSQSKLNQKEYEEAVWNACIALCYLTSNADEHDCLMAVQNVFDHNQTVPADIIYNPDDPLQVRQSDILHWILEMWRN